MKRLAALRLAKAAWGGGAQAREDATAPLAPARNEALRRLVELRTEQSSLGLRREMAERRRAIAHEMQRLEAVAYASRCTLLQPMQLHGDAFVFYRSYTGDTWDEAAQRAGLLPKLPR